MISSFLPYFFGHFLVDFSCAFILMRYSGASGGSDEAVSLFLLYNLLAFGTQFVFGLAGDLMRDNGRIFASAGCLVCAAALVFAGRNVTAAAAVAGIGNAAFHAGGGTDSLTQTKGMTRAGVFVSSGALGIACGARAGSGELILIQYPAALLIFCAACIFILCRGKRRTVFDPVPKNDLRVIPFPALAAAMIIAAIAIRSFVGFAAPVPEHEGRFDWILPAAAAFAGKFSGGILADYISPKIAAPAALMISVPLFFLGSERYYLLVAALFFFNIAMAVTLCELARRLPGREGFAFGLSTSALLLGYLVYRIDGSAPAGTAGKIAVSLLCVSAAIMIFFTSSGRKKEQ